jgi:serine/threonine protein phosphatase PrpC
MNQESEKGGHRAAEPKNLQLQAVDHVPIQTDYRKRHREREEDDQRNFFLALIRDLGLDPVIVTNCEIVPARLLIEGRELLFGDIIF